MHAFCGIVTEAVAGMGSAAELVRATGDAVVLISTVSMYCFLVARSVLAIGALIAPLTIPLLAKAYGWEMAFIIIGIKTTEPLGMALIFTLYAITMLSIIGGKLPTVFIDKAMRRGKGFDPYSARMKAMLIFALFPICVLLAQPLGTFSPWFAVVLIGIGCAAHQSWSANVYTTVGDMFPNSAVATVTGIGGMAGYFIIFCICAFAYVIGWLLMKVFVPKYSVVTLED